MSALWRQRTWLLVGLVALFYMVMSWQQRWVGDDGLIYSRIVEQILAGNGPNFNPGERIEAGTSPLWTWMLAALSLTGLEPAQTSAYMGFVTSLAGLVLVALGAHRMQAPSGPEGATYFPAGIWIYAATPVAWDYTSSGLENGLSMLYVGAVYWASAWFATTDTEAAPADRARAVLGFVAGLGPLVRPELTLYAIGVLGYLGLDLLWRRPRRWGVLAKLVAVSGTLPVAYQLFRMGYYAAIVPNTAVAKSAFGARWTQGFYFFENFFGLYWLGFPMAIALLLLARAFARTPNRSHARVLTALPALTGALLILYVVRSGGGFMHGRMFLVPVFLLLAPIATTPLLGFDRDKGIAATTVLVAWAVAIVGWVRVSEVNQHTIGDERGWYERMAEVDNPMHADDYAAFWFHSDAVSLTERATRGCPRRREVAADVPFVYLDLRHFGDVHPFRLCVPLDPETVAPGTRLVAQRAAIGISGNVLLGHPIHLADHHGLADPVVARLIPNVEGRPGHERFMDNFWLAARFSLPYEDEDPWVTSGRNALRCGEIAELTASVREPLTFRRFVRNIGLSLQNHRLEIPANPFEAEAQFCGQEDPHGS